MKRLICTLIVLTVFPFFNYTFSQDTGVDFEVNGYVWQDFSEDIKLGYISGICHGSIHAIGEYNRIIRKQGLLTEQSIKKLLKLHNRKYDFYGATNGQVLEGVNEVYKDYSNKMIAVHNIMNLVFKKIRGELGTEELEKEFQKLRAEASKK